MGEKHLAIVGFSDSTRDQAPYEDEDCEIWGCNHLFRFVPRIDVLFELHDYKELEARYGQGWEAYRQDLINFNGPIYMREPVEEIPTSVKLPFDELKGRFWFLEEEVADGRMRSVRPYSSFKSTIAYMLALALMQGDFKRIALYGIDMIVDSEWHFQRHNLYLFLGWARGLDVDIVIPKESALLKEGNIRYYAWEHRVNKFADTIERLRKKLTERDKELNEMQAENNKLANEVEQERGIIGELKEMLTEESFNGSQHIIHRRIEEARRRFVQTNQKNENLLHEMAYRHGRRDEMHEMWDRMVHAERGEQL